MNSLCPFFSGLSLYSLSSSTNNTRCFISLVIHYQYSPAKLIHISIFSQIAHDFPLSIFSWLALEDPSTPEGNGNTFSWLRFPFFLKHHVLWIFLLLLGMIRCGLKHVFNCFICHNFQTWTRRFVHDRLILLWWTSLPLHLKHWLIKILWIKYNLDTITRPSKTSPSCLSLLPLLRQDSELPLSSLCFPTALFYPSSYSFPIFFL